MIRIANGFCIVILLLLCVNFISWSAIPKNGLILFFDFDSEKGDIVKEKTGSGNDGVLQNGAKIVNEKKNGTGAIKIAGGTQVMVVESFKELEEYQDNTYLFWINFTDPITGGWDQILAKPAPGSDRSPGLWVHTGGLGIHYRYNPGNLGSNRLGPNGENSDFPQNKWYHVAGVKEGANFIIYVDGEEKFKTAVPASHAQGKGTGATGGLYVGNSPAYGGPAAKFLMDDLAVYTRALKPDEIKAVMEGSLAVEAKNKLAVSWGEIKYINVNSI